MNKKPKLDEDDMEWTTEMMKSAKHFNQLPMSLQDKIKSRVPTQSTSSLGIKTVISPQD